MARSRVIWTASAAADADAIAAFVARDSRRYAAAVVERLLQSAEALAELPLSGRAVPEVGDEAFREVFVFSWRLMYKVEPGIVAITAIVHQRQHFQPSPERIRPS